MATTGALTRGAAGAARTRSARIASTPAASTGAKCGIAIPTRTAVARGAGIAAVGTGTA